MYASSPASFGASWRCATCQSSNTASATKCTACGKAAPQQAQQQNTPQQPVSTPQSRSTSQYGTIPSATSSRQQQPAQTGGGGETNNNGRFSNNNNNNNSNPNQPSPVPMMNSTPPPHSAGTPFTGPGGNNFNYNINQQSAARNNNNNNNNAPSTANNNNNNEGSSSFLDNSSRTPPPGPALSPFVGGGGGQNNVITSSTSRQNTPTPGMMSSAQQRDLPSTNPLHYSTGGNNQQQQQQQSATTTPIPYNASSSTPIPSQARRSPSLRTTAERANLEDDARSAGFNHPMQKKEFEMEIDFLRNAINESKKYGMEIEHTVEYLTDLLRRKTLECESLRTLATENYEPVRRAIAEQYKSQKKVEKNAQNELKYFQGRIETLYSERTTLLQENARLRERNTDTERKLLVAQTRQSKPDDDSFFNRVLYDNTDKPPYQEFKIHVNNPQVPLMSLLTQVPPKRAKDLQKMGALDIASVMLEPDVASRLYKFGFFNYAHHLFTILLTEQQNTPESFANDISVGYKRYVDYAKNPPEVASPAKNLHFKEKITRLYSSFMPEQKPELEGLMRLHKGNEADLWNSIIQNMAEIFEEREKEKTGAAATSGDGGPLSDLNANKNDKLSFLDEDGEDVGGSPRFSRNTFADDGSFARKPGDLNYDFSKDKKVVEDHRDGGKSKENDSKDRDDDDDDDYDDAEDEDNDHIPYVDSRSTSPAAARGSALLSNTSSMRGSSFSPPKALRSASPSSAHGDITQEHIDLHTRIVLMCAKYNPEKLYSKDLAKTMQKYPPEVLLTAFTEKYGPEPTGEEKKKLLVEIASL